MCDYLKTADSATAWIFDSDLHLRGEPVVGWSREGRAVVVADHPDGATEPREAGRWPHDLVAVTRRGLLPTEGELAATARMILRDRLPYDDSVIAAATAMYRSHIAEALILRDGDTLRTALRTLVDDLSTVVKTA